VVRAVRSLARREHPGPSPADRADGNQMGARSDFWGGRDCTVRHPARGGMSLRLAPWRPFISADPSVMAVELFYLLAIDVADPRSGHATCRHQGVTVTTVCSVTV
jgi:hypothetical protein